MMVSCSGDALSHPSDDQITVHPVHLPAQPSGCCKSFDQPKFETGRRHWGTRAKQRWENLPSWGGKDVKIRVPDWPGLGRGGEGADALWLHPLARFKVVWPSCRPALFDGVCLSGQKHQIRASAGGCACLCALLATNTLPCVVVTQGRAYETAISISNLVVPSYREVGSCDSCSRDYRYGAVVIVVTVFVVLGKVLDSDIAILYLVLRTGSTHLRSDRQVDRRRSSSSTGHSSGSGSDLI
ncbi:hypothetical protein J3F83DRAFT_737034 [Trichoderma novae-zelandiae]